MYTKSVIAILFLSSSVWSVPQLAAGEEVPFKGSYEGIDTITPLAPPFLSSVRNGTGEATHLGRFTLVVPHIVNTATGTDLGFFSFTAANGDTLTADFTGVSDATGTSGVLSVLETAVITGGTGRFAGASGNFIVKSLFTLKNNLISGSIEGTISSPGAEHASSGVEGFQNGPYINVAQRSGTLFLNRPHPTFTNIDRPGSTATIAVGINPQGDIVGNYTASGVIHAFLLHEGAFSTIDRPGSTAAFAVVSTLGLISSATTLPAASSMASCSTRAPSRTSIPRAPRPPLPLVSTL